MIDSNELMDEHSLSLILAGLGVLILATLLRRFGKLPLSVPILLLALGYIAFTLPLGLDPPDPREFNTFAVHLTEIGVIISLMGVGLKIDRIPHFQSWRNTWRMLGICMPLTILGVVLLGWSIMGLSLAASLLLAAALAPTDPVLASDVQVGEPQPEDPGEKSLPAYKLPRAVAVRRKKDELRFTLTTEAGLNDSLAFPFTYLALILLMDPPNLPDALGGWLLTDVLYRISVGMIAGFLVGWALAQVLLKLPIENEQQKMRAGVGALAATLILYGVTESLGAYGFLAVFVGGLTIRNLEHTQQSHRSLHTFAEQAEQLLMAGILILLGGTIAGDLLDALTWEGIWVGILLVFVVRPLTGMIGLAGAKRLTMGDRLIVSFFGIRGIGCLYYLAYGLHAGSFPEEDLLWATAIFTIALSIFVHGIIASPLINRRDKRILDRFSKQSVD